jgi:hypothetical protein
VRLNVVGAERGQRGPKEHGSNLGLAAGHLPLTRLAERGRCLRMPARVEFSKQLCLHGVAGHDGLAATGHEIGKRLGRHG